MWPCRLGDGATLLFTFITYLAPAYGTVDGSN
nr:MAG TPA: hypothetical protein [Caudoviricetes sp.]